MLIDTNIIVYAHNKESQYFLESTKFLERLLVKRKVFFAIQNLLESYSVFTKILKKTLTQSQTLEIVKYYFSHPNSQIIYPTEKTAKILFELLKKYKVEGEKIYDLNLVALMIENNIKTIYTKNIKDFRGIKEIKSIDPL